MFLSVSGVCSTHCNVQFCQKCSKAILCIKTMLVSLDTTLCSKLPVQAPLRQHVLHVTHQLVTYVPSECSQIGTQLSLPTLAQRFLIVGARAKVPAWQHPSFKLCTQAYVFWLTFHIVSQMFMCWMLCSNLYALLLFVCYWVYALLLFVCYWVVV